MQLAHLRLGKTEPLGGVSGELRNAARVLMEERRLQVREVRERNRDLLQLRRRDDPDRRGLHLEQHPSWVAEASLGEELSRVRGERRDDCGVEQTAGAPAHRLDRQLAAAEALEEGSHRRHTSNTRRKRDRIAFQPNGSALAVEPLEHVIDALLHHRWKPQPPGGRHCDFTGRGREPLPERAPTRHRERDHPRPLHAAQITGHLWQEHPQQLARIGKVRLRRRRVHRQIIIERRRRLMGVRRTPDVMKQRRIEDRRDISLGQIQLAGQARADHTRTGRLARRQPEAKISGQAQTRQKIRQTQPNRHHPTY